MKLLDERNIEFHNALREFENVSLIHGYFDSGCQEVIRNAAFYFPLKSIRTYNNTRALHLYKHISRTIDLKYYNNGNTEKIPKAI